MTQQQKVTCAVCGFKSHILVDHIIKKHDLQPADYVEQYPGSALWSSYGLEKIREHSSNTVLAKQPRPRKMMPIADLFPNFGKRRGFVWEGEYPIFESPGSLTPTLDETYLFPEEQTIDIITVLEKPRRNRVYLKGWSGTGKTTLVFNLAARLNAEVIEWNADSFVTRDHLVGRWIVKDGATVFQHGILPTAMKRGAWLVINEFDTINPLAANILKPMLEDPARLTILENGMEVIEAHPDFRVIATANTWARGDASGLFVNTHTQSDADARRWSARVLLDYLDEEDEKGILKRYFPDIEEEQAERFVEVANKIRAAHKEGRIDKTFSVAEIVNWCENWIVCGKGVHHAARLSFLNALEPDVFTAISELVCASFGQERDPFAQVADKEA
jgi:cobaltochelatase CobS